MKLADLKVKMLADDEVRAEYERLGPVFDLVGEIVEARNASGLTQAEVARRMGTTQSAVARLESARHMPSLNFLTRYAAALGKKIEVRVVS
ncbi:MAG: helix-turn-helix transcriptional regulator [Ancalomicrobiaceae bacterium]|nr:helix-turn-helix transcriptional regulator [Ancalomicrobiaceae bacterium]